MRSRCWLHDAQRPVSGDGAGVFVFLFSFIRLSVGTGAAPNSRCVHFLADVLVYHGSSSSVGWGQLNRTKAAFSGRYE